MQHESEYIQEQVDVSVEAALVEAEAEEIRTAEENAVLHRLHELDLKKAEIHRYYEERDEVVAKAVQILGVDGFFKAPDGTVYQVTKYPGKFTPPSPLFDYKRTKWEGESKGSLAVATAREAEKAGIVRIVPAPPVPASDSTN